MVGIGIIVFYFHEDKTIESAINVFDKHANIFVEIADVCRKYPIFDTYNINEDVIKFRSVGENLLSMPIPEQNRLIAQVAQLEVNIVSCIWDKEYLDENRILGVFFNVYVSGKKSIFINYYYDDKNNFNHEIKLSRKGWYIYEEKWN